MKIQINQQEIKQLVYALVQEKCSIKEIIDEAKDYIEGNYIDENQEDEVYKAFEDAYFRIQKAKNMKGSLESTLRVLQEQMCEAEGFLDIRSLRHEVSTLREKIENVKMV